MTSHLLMVINLISPR